MRDDAAPGWTRRAVLSAGATGAAGTVTACTWLGSDPPPEPPPPDPLEPLLAGTRELAADYAHTIVRHPELASRLEPLRDAHEAHVAALLDLIDRPELATPSPGSSPPPPPDGDRVPAEPDRALSALREAEQAAYDEARDACLDAVTHRAGMLGAICAARATHVEVLS